MAVPPFSIAADDTSEAQAARAELNARYPAVPAAQAGCIVALGGDGFMLETLRTTLRRDVAVYGMNLGSVGFLMNEFEPEGLTDRLEAAQRVDIHPLMMRARTVDGRTVEAVAINEVSLPARDPSDREAAYSYRRCRAAGRAGVRRRPRRNAGRQHCLQSVGAGADHSDRCAIAGAHADQRLPAAALAPAPCCRTRRP